MPLRDAICPLACAILLLWAAVGNVAGQDDYAVAESRLSPEQLEELLAPIALYPDALLAQILAASTYPMDVVKADRWVQANRDPAELDAQDWDPSVKALTQFPTVLQMMDNDLDWTSQLGETYLNQPEEVMIAIQSLRTQARTAGSLQDTPQQRVIVDDGAVQILPANPEIIYVPTYNPTVVYVSTPAPSMVAIRYVGGVRLGPWAYLDCDWRRRCVYYRHWRAPVPAHRVRHYVGTPSVHFRGQAPGWEGERWMRDRRLGPPPRGGAWLRHAGRREDFRGRDNSASRRRDAARPNRVFHSPQNATEVRRIRDRGHDSRKGSKGTVHSPSPAVRARSNLRPPSLKPKPRVPSAVATPRQRGRRPLPRTPGAVGTPRPQRNTRSLTTTPRPPSVFNAQQPGSDARAFSNRGSVSRSGGRVKGSDGSGGPRRSRKLSGPKEGKTRGAVRMRGRDTKQRR